MGGGGTGHRRQLRRGIGGGTKHGEERKQDGYLRGCAAVLLDDSSSAGMQRLDGTAMTAVTEVETGGTAWWKAPMSNRR